MGTVIYTRGTQAVEVDEADTDLRTRMVRDGWDTEPEVAAVVESDGLDALTRDELNDLAAEHGIEDAGALPNKGAVINALRAASADADGRDGTEA